MAILTFHQGLVRITEEAEKLVPEFANLKSKDSTPKKTKYYKQLKYIYCAYCYNDPNNPYISFFPEDRKKIAARDIFEEESFEKVESMAGMKEAIEKFVILNPTEAERAFESWKKKLEDIKHYWDSHGIQNDKDVRSITSGLKDYLQLMELGDKLKEKAEKAYKVKGGGNFKMFEL